MIVVDSNVIAYCWLNSRMTRLAQRVRVKDPDWHVPVLWRSEVRSILAGYLRDGSLSATQARRVMREVEADQNLAVQAAAIALRARLQPRVQAVGDVLECQCRHGPPLWNRNGFILTQRPPDGHERHSGRNQHALAAERWN